MRYLVGFVCVLAGLAALPLSASAQDVEADASSEPNLQEPAPSTEPAPEVPALQLELDSAGVEAAPSPPGNTPLEETRIRDARTRIRRAGIGLGVSLAAFGGGTAMMVIAIPETNFICIFPPCPPPPNWAPPVAATGVLLTTGGFVGIIVSAILMGRAGHERRELQEAHYGAPRRVQWDLARSRLVF